MNHTHARLNPVRRGCGKHTHRFTQLLFGLGGTVHCDLAGGAFDVSVGQIGIVPRRAPHFFVGRCDDSRLLVVDLYMDDDVVRQIERLGGGITLDDVFIEPRALALPGELVPMVGCAARQLMAGSSASALLAHQWATTFAVQAYELLHGAASADQSRADRFHAFIDARLSQPPTNAELQQHMYMSSTTLNQWCRLCFDLTPQQVVLRRRLAVARQDLISTRRSIVLIAHETGFADAPTFTRAFRRVYADTPAAVRRAQSVVPRRLN